MKMMVQNFTPRRVEDEENTSKIKKGARKTQTYFHFAANKLFVSFDFSSLHSRLKDQQQHQQEQFKEWLLHVLDTAAWR